MIEDYKSGVCEFALWNGNKGYCIYRKDNKFWVDIIKLSINPSQDKCQTIEITKEEFLKYLANYGKNLKNERM